MKNNSTLWIIAIVVVGGAGFFAGTKYQQTQSASQFATNSGRFAGQAGGPNGASGARGQGGRFANGRGAAGEVMSVDATSITVKLPDGSSKIVNLSNSTTFSKTDSAVKTDIKTGVNILATGTTNSDGSITAQNIQLNPMFGRGPENPTPTK